MAISFPGIKDFHFPRMKPVNNITPFTYSDGSTYLNILHALESYIKNNLVPDVDSTLSDFTGKLNELIEEMENGVVNDREAVQVILDKFTNDVLGEYGKFTGTVTDKVDTINNKTGAVDIQRRALTTNYTVSVDPTWPKNQPVYFVLTQDSVGGRSITLPDYIYGPLDVNNAPNAVTEFWLFPKDNGSKWYIFQPESSAINSTNDKANSKLLSQTGTLTRQVIDSLLTPVHENLSNLDGDVTSVREALNAASQELTERISTETKKITRVYTVDPIDVVTIGDSWFTGYQKAGAATIKDIPAYVGDFLNNQGTNQYRIRNYAVAGTGFISGGANNYEGQFNRASADASINNCRIVIVGGGQNDYGRTVYTEAKSVFAKIRAKWPNALVYYVPMWSTALFTQPYHLVFTSALKAARDHGVITDANSLWIHSLSEETDWSTEGSTYHPKDPAVQSIAQGIFSMTRGGTLQAQSMQMPMAASNVSLGVATLDGFNVTLAFQQMVGAGIGPSYNLGNVGWRVLRPATVKFIHGYGAGGGEEHLFTLDVSGSITLTKSVAGGGMLGMTGSYPLGM